MKTIATLSFLATLTAALFAPISLELAGSLLLATGLATILTADYKRRARLPNYGAARAAGAGAAAPFRLAA